MGMFSHTDRVGVLWFKREDYARFLALVPDAEELPATFDQWQSRANEALALIKREGGRPILVEVTPEKLAGWCAIRGSNVDRAGRNAFASDPANWPASEKN